MYPSRNGLYSQRPAAGNAGKIWTPTDGLVQYYDNGTKWLPLLPGVGVPGSEPAPGNVNPFTLISQGSIGQSLTVQGGSVILRATGNGGSTQVCNLAEVTRTGNTGPQGFFRSRGHQVSNRGVYVRDISSGKFLMFGLDINTSINTAQQLVAIRFNNQTSVSAVVFNDLPSWHGDIVGLRLRNDGTNYNGEISVDGVNWFTVYSETVAAFVPSGGDHCGFMIDPYSGPSDMVCLAWDVK